MSFQFLNHEYRLPGQVRRSETVEQQSHEKFIYEQLAAADKSKAIANGTDGKEAKGLKGKLKGFYNNVILPAFPEPIADIKIFKNMRLVEHHVTKNLHDTTIFPEAGRVAEVRRGNGLSPGEKQFVQARKLLKKDAFARYIGLDPGEVHPDDVPIISFGGSGGGFRAMLGVVGYCNAFEESGLWDLIMYVAGVSGACWSLAAYFTFSKTSWGHLVEHCKERLAPYHPLSPEAVRILLTSPGGAHMTLGPLVQKRKSDLETVAMDLYSVFTTGYLFMQLDPALKPRGAARKEVAGYHHDWLKWSSGQEYLLKGEQPMPILTAIRHERPWRQWADEEHPFKEPDHGTKEHAGALDAWFQWFEMTPFEVGCDELEAWVPTWGFGRPYEEGKSTMQLPEQSLALLLGLATSAPAGPLDSYLSTISRSLPTGFIGNQIHDLASGVAKLWGQQGTEQFRNHHPLHACNEHNFLYHLSKVQPGEARPPGIENSPRIHLIDSGLDNNCPTYVLLHPSRDVDVIINMDASSDVQKDSFPQRVDQIGSRKGLKFQRRHEIKSRDDPNDPDRFKGLYAQIYDGTPLNELPETIVDSYGNTVRNPPAPLFKKECTMIYMPLLPNYRAVPDFDPSTAKFSGSYNLVWTPEQVEMLIKVCKQNFLDSEGTIKEVLHEAWIRKREARLRKEREAQGTAPQAS